MKYRLFEIVIPVTTVSGEIIEEKERKVGYISITTFGSETAKEWAIASEKLIGDGAEAIVIDVRGNPGGYLHSVGAILSSLLQEDTVYAYYARCEWCINTTSRRPIKKN